MKFSLMISNQSTPQRVGRRLHVRCVEVHVAQADAVAELGQHRGDSAVLAARVARKRHVDGGNARRMSLVGGGAGGRRPRCSSPAGTARYATSCTFSPLANVDLPGRAPGCCSVAGGLVERNSPSSRSWGTAATPRSARRSRRTWRTCCRSAPSRRAGERVAPQPPRVPASRSPCRPSPWCCNCRRRRSVCTKPQPPCALQPLEPLHVWNTVTGAHWLVPAFGPEAV